MLDLFKNKKNNPAVWQKDFQDGFSMEQKAAIILSMGFVANCDGQTNQKELDVIVRTANDIGINLEKELIPGGIMNMTAAKGIEYFGKVLSKLQNDQKEWFLVCLFNLIHSDSNVVAAEVNEVLNLAEDIGISSEKYKEIIEKWDKLYELFMK